MVRKVFLLLLVLLLGAGLAAAQSDSDNQSWDSDRFPNLPYYSYGSGLGLTTPDSTFRLNIRFRMQNRVTYLDEDGREPTVDAVVRRLRLRFDGFVGDPRFLYAIQLSFAPGDVGTISDGQNLNVIRDAIIFYRPDNNWNIGFGQTKLPGNRQRINSSGALQLTDRSINNATFTIDRDFGLFINYEETSADQFSWAVRTAISTGNGRNWTLNPDTKLAYTGKIELFPFGTFTANGTLFEGDVLREQTPKLMLSAAYHYNSGAQRTRGQTGANLYALRDITSFLADVMFKYQGFAFQTSYMNRKSDNPLTITFQPEPGIRAVDVGYGMDYQVSYLFENDYEIIGRYSWQKPDPDYKTLRPNTNQYSFGLTKYIWEHSLKVQGELTYHQDDFLFGERNLWYARFEVEIGI